LPTLNSKIYLTIFPPKNVAFHSKWFYCVEGVFLVKLGIEFMIYDLRPVPQSSMDQIRGYSSTHI
jgi:hypothetical protein